jgi:hypothetical protein
MLGMEVGWPVLLVEHPDHDTEERRDDQHTREVYAASRHLAPVGLTPGISCERSIRSTLVSFIPLFGGPVFYRNPRPSTPRLIMTGRADAPAANT